MRKRKKQHRRGYQTERGYSYARYWSGTSQLADRLRPAGFYRVTDYMLLCVKIGSVEFASPAIYPDITGMHRYNAEFHLKRNVRAFENVGGKSDMLVGA